MITLNVNSLENAEIFWKELGLENEIALNEAFEPELQTLALEVEYIDEIRDKVIELRLPTGPIVEAVGGKHMFTFIAPEGNTFILIGEWVAQPMTFENRAAYFENMKKVEVVSADKVADLPDGAVIMFGRVTCPWCRRMSKQVATVDHKIYYVDTEDTDLNPTLQAVREQYGVKTVPTIVKLTGDGFVKFDKKKQTLAEFVGEV